MKISKHARRSAKQLFKSCLRNGQLDDELVRRAVSAVIESKPRQYIAVLTHFKRLVKLEVQRRTALVETVIELTPAQNQRIRESLMNRYGPGLRFIFVKRPELIGGMRVQVGSDVFDGSIRARLEMLKTAFTLHQQI